jgi:hypothetical protein
VYRDTSVGAVVIVVGLFVGLFVGLRRRPFRRRGISIITRRIAAR